MRGLKGRCRSDVSLPRRLTPAPSLLEETGSFSTPISPSDSTQAPYLGKDTKLEQSTGGCPRHSPRALEMEPAGAGPRCRRGTAGKSLLWTGP